VVIPAAVNEFVLKPQGEVELLCSSLPVEKEARLTELAERTAGIER